MLKCLIVLKLLLELSDKKLTMEIKMCASIMLEGNIYFKAISEQSLDLILVVSEQFEILYSNTVVGDFLNLSPKDIIGKNLFEFFSCYGVRSPVTSQYFKDPIATIEDEVFSWKLSVMIDPDSSSRSLLMVASKFEKERCLTSYIRRILDCAPGSLYWKDKEGRYLGCNQFMVNAAGLISIDDIIGKTDFDLWADNAEKIRENDQRVINSGEALELEESVRVHDGTLMFFTGVKMPLRDEHGEIIGVIGNSLDITRLKRTEQALKQAKEEAENANRMKTDFIHNMEHDIRTPFNGIFGLAQILAQREQDPEMKENLTDIASCAGELLSYCDGILDFSKMENEPSPILDKVFEPRKLIESVIAIESVAVKSKGLELLSHYSDDLPHKLIGDQNRIKRVLINLVSNAVKFTKSGWIKISAELVDTQFSNGRQCAVKFVVEDTGIGIPENKQDIIYEKFVRGTPSNQGIYKGQGLGLRIVRQYVDDLDGEIILESEQGKGSKFSILLPFKLSLLEST